MTRPDIDNEEKIKLMVDSFYALVNEDPLLSPIFNDVAKVNWDHHLPRMYKFWNTLILSKAQYKGSPFDKHVPLPIDQKHFDRWIGLFHKNIDNHFEGPKAEDTKMRASSIGHIFSTKLSYLKM